jgi:outer membrane lipase/esterase
MHKRQGMTKRGVACGALLLGAVAGAQAGDYSNVYIFGDSLSDSGAYRPIVGGSARFTTNPGTVWGENLGASYGKAVTPAYAASLAPLGFSANAGGNNFAVGSARVNAQPPVSAGALGALAPFVPSVSTQVSSFLARGAVDPQALYALWAGGNDVFAAFVAGAGAPSAAAVAAMVTAASDLTAQVVRLQSAGARNLVVLGLADSSRFPYALAMSDPEREQVRQLNAAFDTAFVAQMADKHVLYFDTGKLIRSILATPLAYGFTNTIDKACGATPALVCSVPANGHLFADDKHPTTLFHKVVSDWIYGSLEGASRVGLLSQVPLGRSGAQWRSIDGRLQQFQNFGYQGQGFFVTGDYASSQKDAAGGLPSADGSGGSFVLGYEKAFSDQLYGGVTLGYGNAPFDLGNHQGSVKYDEWALSAFAAHKFGAFYANALTTYSWLNYESNRNVVLGSFSGSEQGETRGGQWGVKGQVGYNFVSGNLVHGPLAGLAWERVKVDAFSEKSNSVTAMSFGEQVRESLRSRLGWQVAAETSWSGVAVRPYAQLTYDYEHKKDERTYRAGFVGGISGLEMPTANQTGGYGTLLAGFNAQLNKTMRLGVGASTTINQPGARNSSINVTLSASL